MTAENFILDPGLRAQWAELLSSDHPAAQQLYFDRILPKLVDHLVRTQGDPLRERQALLVSLMGFSPATTVIACALLRPRRLVVVTTEQARASYDRAAAWLVDHEQIQPSGLVPIIAGATDPVELYRKIRGELEQAGGSGIIDISGGTKIMSAAAAQVAWELGLPLCYVEGRYRPELRAPEPGSEKLELLARPSHPRGRTLRIDALRLYAQGHYAQAGQVFAESARYNEANGPDQLGAALCAVYGALMDLDRDRIAEEAGRLRALADQPRAAALVAPIRGALERQLAALEALAEEDAVTRIAAFVALAGLYGDHGRHDFACLLAYRAMEALVAEGLRRQAGGAFDTGRPDYSALGDAALLERELHQLAQEIDPQSAGEPGLPRKLGLVNGFAVLCLLDATIWPHLHRKGRKQAVLRLREMAALRNESILAHGQRTLDAGQSRLLVQTARELALAILGPDHARFEERCAALHRLPLDDLAGI